MAARRITRRQTTSVRVAAPRRDRTGMRRASLCFLVLATACGPTAPGHTADDDAADDTSGDDDGGPVPDAWHNSGPDAATECGNQTQDIGVQNLGDPPDLLIVLDRS